jgi:hypothetical protein
MASAVAGMIGMAGMIIGVFMNANSFDQKSADLDQSIEDMQDKLTNYKAKYESLFKAQGQLDAEIKDYMNDLVEEITQNSDQIRVAKNRHSEVYRSIQISGLIFIVTLTFIFITKIFGIDKYMNSIFSFKK